ncbi:MAG: 4-alpha-glucanotransferase [Actinomycetota bacterium]
MVRLGIHYDTVPGQQVVVQRPGEPDHVLDWTGGGWWGADVDLGDGERYRYAVRSTDGTTRIEAAGSWRRADAGAARAIDRWRTPAPRERSLGSSIFERVLRRRPVQSVPPADAATHRFRLHAPDLDLDRRVVLVGGGPELGNWDPVDGLALRPEFPYWTADVAVGDGPGPVEYKYAVVGGEQGGVVWEEGPNRIAPRAGPGVTLVNDQDLGWSGRPWRGAGVVLPLFSLRVEDGAGIGRFSDLPRFVDWAVEAGLSVIQLLPINDTTLTHGPADSYPYSPISSVALHPQHLDPAGIGTVADPTLRAELAERRRRLDEADGLDQPAVMELLHDELRALFVTAEPRLAADPEFAAFIEDESDWLDDYAAFCILRDRHGPHRTDWGDDADHRPERIAELVDPTGPTASEATYHRWVQWHLHRQLDAATAYARRRGVALKGDLPIGVSADSADVWAAPELFDRTHSVGAPPDDFAAGGQNWMFPVYRWPVMARDGYAWWRRRLAAMGRAFDAYRIDHVLGFFRIWTVPLDQVEGTMGRFSPCLPLSEGEVRDALGWFDHDRLCRPFLSEAVVRHHLGDDLGDLVGRVLTEVEPGWYRLTDGLETQRALEERFADDPRLDGLLRLPAEVLLLEVADQNGRPGYHPRVDPHRTRSFHALAEGDRTAWVELVNEFFHRRHGEQWEAWGRTTLPAVLDASHLLVCGEDLGVVPDFVPGVLRELGVLTLDIERMPKRLGARIADPAVAPELCVVATGTHDMPTMRSWWESERAQAAEVWRSLGRSEAPPADCGEDVATALVRQHLDSPAQWSILPLQDLLAIDEAARHPDTTAEQINVPANPKHVWSYRMHLTVEDLAAHPVTERIRTLVERSGRSTPTNGSLTER